MGVKITRDRTLSETRGAKDGITLSSILSGTVPGESFFVKNDGGEYKIETCRTVAARMPKKFGLKFAVCSYTENGVKGFIVYCVDKQNALT